MTQQQSKQIVLDVDLPDEQTFASFVEGENQVALSHCKALMEPKLAEDLPFLTFISGNPASGKTHLMVAMCQRATQHKIPHFFVSLDHPVSYPFEILDGLEHTSLICIDNVHNVSEHEGWQKALFDLINRVREVGQAKLVISANQGPKSLPLSLPDLRSRLTWGVSFHLENLDELCCVEALTKKARLRGIRIPVESIRFLVTHSQRGMHSLTKALEELQLRSLQEKRKISIPFIKQILDI